MRPKAWGPSFVPRKIPSRTRSEPRPTVAAPMRPSRFWSPDPDPGTCPCPGNISYLLYSLCAELRYVAGRRFISHLLCRRCLEELRAPVTPTRRPPWIFLSRREGRVRVAPFALPRRFCLARRAVRTRRHRGIRACTNKARRGHRTDQGRTRGAGKGKMESSGKFKEGAQFDMSINHPGPGISACSLSRPGISGMPSLSRPSPVVVAAAPGELNTQPSW